MLKLPRSRIRIKYSYIWLSLVLISLAAIGIFSSQAQSLLSPEPGKIAEVKSRNTLPQNPVYGPLARSVNFRTIPPAPVKTASSDNLTPLDPSFSWNGWSELEWWVPEEQDLSSDTNWLREINPQALPDRISAQDLFPKLQSRDIDPQAIMSNFVTLGVADLLDDLSEQEAAGTVEEEAANVNPFEKALKEAIDEAQEAGGESEPETIEEEAESDPTDNGNEEADSTDEAAVGGGAGIDCNLIFIGSFGGRPLATAIGTVQPDLIHQAMNHPVYIDLKEAGKQYLDIDVILRDRNGQKSVAFGDLDGDGFIDMVVTNTTTHRAHLFKSDGQGDYAAVGEIFAGPDPEAAVISDFNSDGSADVAVGNRINKKIVVDGKDLRIFNFLPTSRVAEEFTSMIPYDFDGDGLMDLLLSNYENLKASIYLNKGKAIFAASDSYALQEFPLLQSLVDLDGDGIGDYVYIQNLGDNISVVTMNGKNGAIANLGNITLDSSLYFVLGDFNMDGIVDVALAHRK